MREVEAPRAGAVTRLGAIQIGQAALHLGAGRRAKEDSIDHAVGIVCRVKRGAKVDAGDVLAEVHARDDAAADEAVREVLAAYELGDEPPPERSILLDVVGDRDVSDRRSTHAWCASSPSTCARRCLSA